MTMTLIKTTTVGVGGAATVTFSSIPQTFTDLVCVFSIRTNFADVAQNIGINLPNSTGQTARNLVGTGSATTSASTAYDIACVVNAANATANTFGNGSVYIPNYSGSANKTFSGDSVAENNATAANLRLGAGARADVSAITSLEINGLGQTILENSTISLYGITKGSDGIVTVS